MVGGADLAAGEGQGWLEVSYPLYAPAPQGPFQLAWKCVFIGSAKLFDQPCGSGMVEKFGQMLPASAKMQCNALGSATGLGEPPMHCCQGSMPPSFGE